LLRLLDKQLRRHERGRCLPRTLRRRILGGLITEYERAA